ncbi:MAG TPA: LacI family DNA-binding transcriptional regulator [Gryllotalpicola sp.]
MTSVTLSDVAQRAGVSESTVSRVLSQSRPVTPAIEATVRRAAAELGYSGNSIARALRRQRTDTVGMVVPSILNPFFTALVDSIERALHDEGRVLFLCDSRQDPAIEAGYLRLLVDRKVDGIVVSPVDGELSRAAIVETATQVPLVQLDRRVNVENTDWVGVDDDDAMRQIVSHLADNGVRTAAFVTSDFTNSSTRDRLDGFRRHAADLGIETRDDWMVFGDYSVESGHAAAVRLLSGTTRPEAIVCADDLIAFGVLQAARELGIPVPGSLQVTGFDNLVFAEHVIPPLTSIEQPTPQMAEEALRLMRTRMQKKDRLPGARVALVPRLVVRGSTGVRP